MNSSRGVIFAGSHRSGTGNRIMTSADGLNWTVRSSPADLGWRSLCWSPQRGQFAAVSNSGAGNRVMVSP